jgi:PAS domain S-box-containing protein
MGKAKILIVEDEAIIAMELESQLQSLGYEVTSIVDTGEKAIEKTEIDNPDLILMDIRIKGEMDGIDTAEVIRSKFRIPVIFSTAYLDQEKIERAKITMPFGYVLKPIQERDLRVTIEMALYVSKVDQERRKVEVVLKESEENLRRAHKNAHMGTWKLDFATNKVVWSEELYKMYGFDPAFPPPLLNESNTLFTKESWELLSTSIAKTGETGVPYDIELKLIRKDGSSGWMWARGEAVLGEDGKIVGLRGEVQDITQRKQAEEELKETESRIRTKLDAILSPSGDIGSLNLADIMDVQEIQSMMDDYYKLTNIAIGILDVNGTVLVHTGWQDICVKFHRVHPETLKNCIEADTELSKGVKQGEFKLYKCKNNMWDMSTPIIIGGQHLGNIFFGQFFFKNEVPDRNVFIQQAQQYDYNQKEYLNALDKVPSFSRETVEIAMSFYSKFASKIAELGYSNIKLARTLNKNGNSKKN